MEAKDKAIDLKVKFLEIIPDSTIKCNKEAEGIAILNAIICVEEILNLCKKEFDTSIYSPADYWKEVITELEKMK
ncbi:hypothetical protein M2T28_14595 [Elizabethkingia miricola]|uniref:hypothetical protein n=1 Tax=Elizabethkingia miricola TaxID=172045 RepID=UPI00061C8EB0|nr:hypothetical protein [Elizabethkingia miricola]MCL1653849.1 hypothetical protein [Elizabethkingia miricola]WQM37635.1 hypothetical protein U2S95_14845 [Elizabethkingia miricola]CRH24879.1 Uncharacterised protein [Chlamydia trachomatis]